MIGIFNTLLSMVSQEVLWIFETYLEDHPVRKWLNASRLPCPRKKQGYNLRGCGSTIPKNERTFQTSQRQQQQQQHLLALQNSLWSQLCPGFFHFAQQCHANLLQFGEIYPSKSQLWCIFQRESFRWHEVCPHGGQRSFERISNSSSRKESEGSDRINASVEWIISPTNRIYSGQFILNPYHELTPFTFVSGPPRAKAIFGHASLTKPTI